MKKTALFGNDAKIVEGVYGGGRRERLAAISSLLPDLIADENFDAHADELAEVEAIFSTWTLPSLDAERLDRMPALKALFYGAGSVKSFAPLLLERGIRVVGAWHLNAIPVAEYLFGAILLANKGFFRHIVLGRNEGRRYMPQNSVGNFEVTVGLLGAGQIGRELIRRLNTTGLRTLVYDPHLDDTEAQALGVEKTSIEEVFERSMFVSNHIPQLPETKDAVSGDLLRRLPERAAFANVANGHSLAWGDLLAVVNDRPDLMFILDTVDGSGFSPEELDELFARPNAWLTGHVAGALGPERRRLADGLIDEFERWAAGKPFQYEITSEMLGRMA